jgi:hypothetical protein
MGVITEEEEEEPVLGTGREHSSPIVVSRGSSRH